MKASNGKVAAGGGGRASRPVRPAPASVRAPGAGSAPAVGDRRAKGHLAARLAVPFAVAGSLALLLCLGVRPLTSLDLGYHLAYGEKFLDEGRLVDSGEGVYSNDAYAHGDTPGEFGPGCWLDQQGLYRFPNANWLTQIAFAAVHRWAGATGLSVLRLGLVAAIGALSLLTMRNLRVPWALSAAGVVLLAMACYPRFLLRPELVGFVPLAGQLAVLSFSAGRQGADRLRLCGPTMAALVALQLVLVNVHSYFLLGLALTGAALADRLGVWAWSRYVRGDRQSAAALAVAARRLGLVLGLQVLACLANPWTWRLAVMPLQTLAFFHRYDLTNAEMASHPWAMIGEFFRPFAERGMTATKATAAFYVLLGVTAAGALAAAVMRRWAALLMVAGMTAVALSMRRNIAPAAVVIIPLSAWLMHEAAAKLSLAARALGLDMTSVRRWGPPAAAGAVGLLGLALAWQVVTQRFYIRERSEAAFGMGYDRARLAIGAAEWINANRPAGRVWVDYNTSSNLHYFVRPHPPLPVLTNTWAYPPEVMARVLSISRGKASPDALDDAEIVVLHPAASEPLIRRLAGSGHWAVVAVEGQHVVFLRRDGLNAELASSAALTPERLDLAGMISRIEQSEWQPGQALHSAGGRLYVLGWRDEAITLLRRSLRHNEDAMVMNLLGKCLAERARDLFAAGDRQCIEDVREALSLLERAQAADQSVRGVGWNVRQARSDLERYRRATASLR